MRKLLNNLKSTKAIGDKYEQVAQHFLSQENVTFISHNYHSKAGEIDLIGLKDNILIFFEVRARSNIQHGLPEETITHKKQERIRRTASKFLQTNTQYRNTLCRFDVISITYSETDHAINWIKNAF
ncbi:YraN family protein [Litoribrevibacter euphylliae]|uniref:UPF0102 protein ACFOEK_21100 n=1 Tax=Litoribrevibacter euphylliae TaxID=1834034 RepID=A0ABV7HM53_9GAMM